MFDFIPIAARPAAITAIAMVLGLLIFSLLVSFVTEEAEGFLASDLPPDEPGDRIRGAIIASAAREARVIGHPGQFILIDEDGEIDTRPPLSADREQLLRKIDRVEQDMHRQLAFKGGAPRCGELMHRAMDETAEVAVPGWWRNLESQKRRAERALHGFPVSLIGRGVTIPPAHQGELA